MKIKFLKIIIVLCVLGISGSYFWTQLNQSKAFCNSYSGKNVNSSDSEHNCITESQINNVELFSSNIAVLTQNYQNSFTMSDDAGEMLLVDDDKNEIIYSKNSMKEVAPASTTKLLTAYIVLQNCKMDEVVNVQSDIYLEDGAVALYLQKGDTITVDELLHALLIESANDAAVVLAEHVSGSVSEFAKKMNDIAVSLGATHSHFMNPNGLDQKGHVSCAYDLYLILKQDMAIPHFCEIVAKDKYTVKYQRADGEEVETPITTTNHYLGGEVSMPKDVTVIGGKTGTTSNAGNCLAIYAENSSKQHLYGIVLHATTKNSLYDTMSALLMQQRN